MYAKFSKRVIDKKPESALALDYPKEKLHIPATYDNSLDDTNDIVNECSETTRTTAPSSTPQSRERARPMPSNLNESD